MSSDAGEPRAPGRIPWYARRGSLVAAAIAAAVGVVLVVIGVVSLVGASGTRDEAGRIRDEADEVARRARQVSSDAERARDEADDVRQVPRELDRRIDDLFDSLNHHAELQNGLDDCLDTAIVTLDESALVACFEERFGSLQVALEDVMPALEQLRSGLLLADEARDGALDGRSAGTGKEPATETARRGRRLGRCVCGGRLGRDCGDAVNGGRDQ